MFLSEFPLLAVIVRRVFQRAAGGRRAAVLTGGDDPAAGGYVLPWSPIIQGSMVLRRRLEDGSGVVVGVRRLVERENASATDDAA